MKKILALAMTLAMIVSMCAVVAVAAPEEEGVVTLTSTVTPVAVGETLTVSIDLATTAEVGAIAVDVLYNKDALELIPRESDSKYFKGIKFLDVEAGEAYGYTPFFGHVPNGDKDHAEPYARFTLAETTVNPVGRFGGEGSKLANPAKDVISVDFKVKAELTAKDINIVVGDISGATPSSKITSKVDLTFKVELNTKALEDAIKAAEAKIAEIEANVDYEAPTALKDAVAAAKETLKTAADQAAIDAAVETLNKAVADFVPVVKVADKTALVAEIEKAEKIDLTAEGIKADKVDAFKAALEAAKAMNEKEDAKQSEVDAAAAALKDAAAALVDTADVNVVVLSILAVVALAGAALIIAKRRHA